METGVPMATQPRKISRFKKAKERKTRKPYIYRDFLNQAEFCGGAMVKVMCNNRSYAVEISDCSNHIRLHSCITDKEEKDNGLYKIDKLIEALQGLKENVILQYAEIEKENTKREERKQQRKNKNCAVAPDTRK